MKIKSKEDKVSNYLIFTNPISSRSIFIFKIDRQMTEFSAPVYHFISHCFIHLPMLLFNYLSIHKICGVPIICQTL